MSFDTEDIRSRYELTGMLLIVVYAPGGYDLWDLLIGVLGTWFSFGYLWHVTPKSKGEIVIPALIGSLSAKIVVTTLISFFIFGYEAMPIEAHDEIFGKSQSFIAVIIFAAGIWFAFVRKNKLL